MSSIPEPRFPNAGPCDRSKRELVGTVDRVLWMAGDDSGLLIAALTAGDVVKGTVTTTEPLERGMCYRFVGRWEEHPQHGMQFSFGTYVKHLAPTENGVCTYLEKCASNVGYVRARKLWTAFGADAVRVLREEPARVVQAGIMREDEAKEASLDLHNESAFEQTKIDLYELFVGRGFPGSLTRACIEQFGARAAAVVKRNPYVLLVRSMPGCGFRRCDKLYLDRGGDPAATKRQMLCAWHYLREETTGQGHTWKGILDVQRAVQKVIPAATAESIATAIRLGKRSRWLATRRDDRGSLWVADYVKADNERIVAEKVAELRAWPNLLWPASDSLPVGEGQLSAHQHDRVRLALVQPVGILAGTPGTGKTYTTAVVVRELARCHGTGAIAVCAPTGKAAVRCSAAMARYGIPIEATTIHRLLVVGRNGHDRQGWAFKHNEKNLLLKRFIVVDETSMLDTDLAAALLRACSPGTHVLFVGDPYQLPPVGHGAPLRDMIAAGVPCGELTEIQRNAGLIVRACAAIKDGQRFETCDKYDPDATPPMNLRLFPAEKPEAAAETLRGILAKFAANRKFDPVWDCQVLVAVNAKSPLSRAALNAMLQADLNPDGISVAGNPYRVGDKIICTRNSLVTLQMLTAANRPTAMPESYRDVKTVNGDAEQVFLANGEIGRVLAVGPKVVVAEFPTPTRVVKLLLGKASKATEEGSGEADEPTDKDQANTNFDLAYAITVHKAQGSEWPCMICMIDEYPGAKRIASREFWYTAISRARDLCILVGKRETCDQQAKRVALLRRKTFLVERLKGGRSQ
jgi:exodeoxyribonuclease V alpha subunit